MYHTTKKLNMYPEKSAKIYEFQRVYLLSNVFLSVISTVSTSVIYLFIELPSPNIKFVLCFLCVY